MKITDIKIRKIFKQGALRAVVSIVLDDVLVIHEIHVVQNKSRLFIAMPSRRDENGKYRDVVHPISAIARQEFENVILKAYRNHIALINENTDIGSEYCENNS